MMPFVGRRLLEMTFVPAVWLVCAVAFSAGAAEKESLNVLFIGNSYTHRHDMPLVVKAMAEAGNPNLNFDVTVMTYGGRTLANHWELGTASFVNLATLTADEERATIRSLERLMAEDPEHTHGKTALGRHRELLDNLEERRQKWDVVVLQSYRDDLEGDKSLYAEYAPKFAELIKAQGARVILYETTPTTQNDKPLTTPPDPAPIMKRARSISALAKRIDADVVPMSTVALHCQTERPDLTLRFINDAHLNQTLAYLTACTFYAVLFDRSPEGLPVDKVTDIRFLDAKNKDKDRDGLPITKKFSKKDRTDLQKIAWQGLQQFQKL